MRSCDYCGKENEDAASACIGCGCSLDEPKIDYTFPWAGFFSWAGLLIGLFGTGRAVLMALPFFWNHSDLGPGIMFWMWAVLLTAFYTFLLGLPCAIVAIVKRRRLAGWLGVFLVMAPAPLAFAMFNTAMRINGFHLTD